MERYAVVGYPIDHSLSPLIHTDFAKQIHKTIQYERRLVFPEQFEAAVTRFQEEGWRGLNITAPFKEHAFALVDEVTERAKEAGAVNMLTFHSSGKRFGDNTDGVGFLRDLSTRIGFNSKGKRIAILGAGGAVRGIIGPLLREAPAAIVIINRNLRKAQALVASFPLEDCLTACAWDASHGSFDLIINGTSVRAEDDSFKMSLGIFQAKPLCYDLGYGPESPFIKQARLCEAPTENGLGMLIEQAAEAFWIWHGVLPVTAPLFVRLKSDFTRKLNID